MKREEREERREVFISCGEFHAPLSSLLSPLRSG